MPVSGSSSCRDASARPFGIAAATACRRRGRPGARPRARVASVPPHPAGCCVRRGRCGSIAPLSRAEH